MKTLIKKNDGWESLEDHNTPANEPIVFDLHQLIRLLDNCREAMIELSDYQEGWEDDVSEIEDILALVEESDFDPELN